MLAKRIAIRWPAARAAATRSSVGAPSPSRHLNLWIGTSGLPDAFRDGQTLRHQPYRPERLLLAVAEGEQRIEHVARGRRGAVRRARRRESAPSLSFSSSSSRSAVFLPMPGIFVSRPVSCMVTACGELGDRQPGEHRERGARADAGDPDELAECACAPRAWRSRTACARPRAPRGACSSATRSPVAGRL